MEVCDMSIGIEAFSLFEKRHNVKLQEKYPYIVTKNVKPHEVDFNPNKNYLHFKYSNISEASPFYFLNLIPKTTIKEIDVSPLFLTIDLLHVLNWACYFYAKLKHEHANISPPSKKVQREEEQFSAYLAAEFVSDRKISADEIIKDSQRRNSKNGAILKPAKFMQICRFYARAWFEENFGATGSIKFAYYVSEYITSNSLPYESQQECPYYKINRRRKAEVNNLFKEEELNNAIKSVFENINSYRWFKQEPSLIHPFSMSLKLPNSTKLNFNLYSFVITLEKQYNREKDPFYTIAISQLGCEHYFYKYARLHLERYTSIF